MGEFRMPSLGADMDAGTVVEWRIQPGDEVHRGDIVAVVDTDKADIDVEIFEAGVVDELLVPIGQRVAVGTPLARLHAVGAGVASGVPAPVPPASPPPPTPAAAPPPPAPAPPLVPAPPPARPGGTGPAAAVVRHPVPGGDRVHSPVLRRLARHLGVDLGELAGTGPNGRVTRHDVEAAATAAAAPPPPLGAAPAASTPERPPDHQPPDRQLAQRLAIANLMARSKREIPHYYVATDVDLDAALAWLARTNEALPVGERLLPAALLLKAVALAARAVPELNGFWCDGAFRAGTGVHLGVAVSLRGGGLVAPAIHDADSLDLTTLMGELRDLVQRARSGRLRSSEMADPTITVTNLGDQGVDTVYGVIYPPQVALVGLGKVRPRPVAVGDLLGVHPLVRATLAADHRATDGHVGARFLATLDRLLQAPEQL